MEILFLRGNPDYIEIKGVTFCGTSRASPIRMENVPFHQEVVYFAQQIVDSNPAIKESYEIACEHEHSCCILIANKKFKINGEWNTWINYDKFHELIKEGKPFKSLDYIEKKLQNGLFLVIL